ncbi:MAG: type II secretion system minor pseudopilin GspJ [Gammaproteobacteria bacterium]|jgi:general secretion pathway protein J|nr:type II secretion system minor pseudopilin GspJ [Gammaproteobacteria bacterium]
MKPKKSQRGLTLLELIVAVGVFALFSMMAYGALNRVLDQRDQIEEKREYWRALSLTFLRMEEDMAQARARPVRDIDGTTLPSLRGQSTDTRALADPTLELTRGGVLVFGEGIRSDLQRVGYRLEDNVLLRLTWPVLDRAPQTEPFESPLLRDVETFEVRFYSLGGNWIDVWPVEELSEELPRGVEVTLTLTNGNEFKRVFFVNG